MGACRFVTQSKGIDAKDAFANAVREARWENGNSGYTGSIAEKSTFTLIDLPVGKNAESYADELMTQDDKRVSNKWGPAGCIALKDGFLFFGRASS
jgi:hypothetical protein